MKLAFGTYLKDLFFPSQPLTELRWWSRAFGTWNRANHALQCNDYATHRKGGTKRTLQTGVQPRIDILTSRLNRSTAHKMLLLRPLSNFCIAVEVTDATMPTFLQIRHKFNPLALLDPRRYMDTLFECLQGSLDLLGLQGLMPGSKLQPYPRFQKRPFKNKVAVISAAVIRFPLSILQTGWNSVAHPYNTLIKPVQDIIANYQNSKRALADDPDYASDKRYMSKHAAITYVTLFLAKQSVILSFVALFLFQDPSWLNSLYHACSGAISYLTPEYLLAMLPESVSSAFLFYVSLEACSHFIQLVPSRIIVSQCLSKTTATYFREETLSPLIPDEEQGEIEHKHSLRDDNKSTENEHNDILKGHNRNSSDSVKRPDELAKQSAVPILAAAPSRPIINQPQTPLPRLPGVKPPLPKSPPPPLPNRLHRLSNLYINTATANNTEQRLPPPLPPLPTRALPKPRLG